MFLTESPSQIFERLSNLPNSLKESIRKIARESKIELARRNINDFCEVVVKDEKGKNIAQAEVHRQIQWHIDECRRRGVFCGILAPWRHGKTEQVAIGYTLKLLGEDRNNRIFIVSNSDDNAVARVSSISKYIERDEDYHQVFPNVKPAEKEEWTKHKLIVERESKSKDGSVEAWGITSSGTGAGCDFLIVDDPVDLRNTILNPALRIQVKEAFRNVWLSRLAPNGFMIYIATVWHQDDLTNELLKNPQFYFLKIAVAEDFSCLECESSFKGIFKIPLWQEWNKEKLMRRRKEIGERAFNRGFRQIALSDEDRTFSSANKIFKYGVKVNDIVDKNWPRYTGVDPFGQYVVIFTLAQAPDGKRYPIEIRRGKWSSPATIENLIEVNRIHKPQMLMFENNAAQEAMRQWALEKGERSMPLQSFTTGKQKADPEMGLPGLEVEFSNDAWIVAMGDKKHEIDCECGFCVWKKELENHPLYSTADCVMASWFAREACRKGQIQFLRFI